VGTSDDTGSPRATGKGIKPRHGIAPAGIQHITVPIVGDAFTDHGKAWLAGGRLAQSRTSPMTGTSRQRR